MSDLVLVRYLGPDEIRVLRDARTGETFNFLKGQVVGVPQALSEEVVGMNPRGFNTDAECRAYDAHRFEIVAAAGSKGGGD